MLTLLQAHPLLSFAIAEPALTIDLIASFVLLCIKTHIQLSKGSKSRQ